MINTNNLNIGDVSDNGQVAIIDEDRLCYLVKSTSKGANGLRTISKSLLSEYIEYFAKKPDASANDARDALCGNTDIDKFEYGYTSTLKIMAQMVLGQVGIISATLNSVSRPQKHTIFPLQQIFYGAPGTGKSHKVKSEKLAGVSEENIFRTTFHPDYDYAQFVGCYKPTKENKKETEKQVILDYSSLVEKFKEYLAVQPINITKACTLFGYDYHDSLVKIQENGHTIAQILEDAYKGGTTYSSQIYAGMTVFETSSSQKQNNSSITYSFVPQVFTNALVKAYESHEPVYLVIEEINRGNCAQIFGDIFQLLDRNANGESEYAINVDEDLKKYLEEKCPAAINDGKIKLPSNFNIIATMNTSDQSLFPMDSAFKRRWEWKYVPIERAEKEPEKNWIIKVTHGGKTYWCYWWEFLEAINHQIEETTHSEDKQLGYFFAKPKNGEDVISTDTFVNKVIFYLWNDVFKDEDSAVFQYDNNKVEDVSVNRSGTMYFRHFMANTDEMIHYFINQLFVMGKDNNPVVPIDYLKYDDYKVIEHLPKMRLISDDMPMSNLENKDEIKEEKIGERGKVVYTYSEYEQIFDRVGDELQAVGCERIGNAGNSIDYKLKDIPTSICYVSARLNKTKNDEYGEVLLWMNTNKTEPEKSKKLRDKIAIQTEGVFKTFESGNVTLRTLEKDPTSIESINRGWVLKNPDIKFTDESLDNDAKWIYETMKILLERLQPIIEGALK